MSVVIIGAGQAGARTAEALRDAGYAKGIVLVGEETHLPYERPPLSKAILLGAQASDAATLLPASVYAERAIGLRLGVRAVRVDRRVHTVQLTDGTVLAYERLVFATGLRPRRMQGFPVDEHTFALRTIDDAARLRPRLRAGRRILVVGGGFLGLEVAATARQLGCDVTLVERNASLLYKVVSTFVGDYIVALHRRHGIRVIANATLKRLAPTASDSVSVSLSDDTTFDVDTIVTATGSIPNTEVAEAAGLDVQDGIVVDEFGRTSDPDIFAVGDVSRHLNPVLGHTVRIESWQNAQNQAIAVAKVITGSSEPYRQVPWFWTDQYDMNLQIVGFPRQWDALAMHGEASPNRFTLLYLNGGRVVGANMLNNGRDTRFARKWVEEGTRMRIADVSTAFPLLRRAVPDEPLQIAST